MSLFGELKRRNVFRVAAAYLAGSWLLIEVADTIFPYVNLGETAVRILIVVLAIGFPVTVLLTWVFELTPEGVKLEKDVDRTAPIPGTSTRRLDRAIIVLLVLALGYFAFDKFVLEPARVVEIVEETAQQARSEALVESYGDNSIAVLPFVNMSSDPEQEYFSDGISEELLNLLAQIPELRVISRSSAFYYKGKDVKLTDIARELNVANVLEGSVRKAGNRVRITAQLIEARSDTHLWSETYDRDYDVENLFYIQSEIARAITGQLRMTLTGADEKRLANVPTKNTEAYVAYLLGRQRLTDRKVDDLADAVEQFALAIELDPQFAGACSGLADACDLYESYSGGQSNEHCPPSPAGREQLARKAVELDPESGEAWISLGGTIKDQVSGSLESMPKLREAIAAFERGLELNPNLSQGYHWYGMALRYVYLYPDPPSGWIEAWKAGVWESVFDKGLKVDPLSVPLHYVKAIYPLNTRSKEEAIWHGHRIVEIAPDSPRGYEILGEQAWELKGQIDESIRWESKALERDPKHPAFPTSMGRAYSALGDPDMALAYFDLAKALTAPDNQSLQNDLLVEQAIIRLASGRDDADQVAELRALLSESESPYGFQLGIFLDSAMGKPADALARIETIMPECITANGFPEEDVICPSEIVRVYQEVGNYTAAQNLGDTVVRRSKLWSDGWPADYLRLEYVFALAVTGRTDEALGVLENLVASGWRGDYRDFLRFTLYFDVRLDAVRDEERFQAIVTTIEADMAQQLENVREMQRRGEVPTLEEVKALIASNQES